MNQLTVLIPTVTIEFIAEVWYIWFSNLKKPIMNYFLEEYYEFKKDFKRLKELYKNISSLKDFVVVVYKTFVILIQICSVLFVLVMAILLAFGYRPDVIFG